MKKPNAFPLVVLMLLVAILAFVTSRRSDEVVTGSEPGAKPLTVIPVKRSVASVTVDQKLLPALTKFDQWLEGHLQAGAEAEVDLAVVRRLAEARGEAMLELIQRNPRRALEQSLSWHEWEALPPEIQGVVEQPFSATGDFEHFSDCRPEGSLQERIHPFMLSFDDGREQERTYPFGRRQDGLTESGVPLQGITLAGHSALWSSPVFALDERDYAAVAERFPHRNDAEQIGTRRFAALIGGKIYHFSSEEARSDANEMLLVAEELHGPNGGRMALAAGAAPDEDEQVGGEFDLEAGSEAAETASSQWTETTRNVWVFRIAFSDAGFPVDNISSRISGASNNIIAQSYAKTSLNLLGKTDIQLPNSQFWYTNQRDSQGNRISRNTSIRNAVQAAASNMGVDTSGAHWFVYQFSNYPSDRTPASALVGGADHWVNGNRVESIWVHEFGHQYGLGHANYRWGLARGTYELSGHLLENGDAAESLEYGDKFDIMGPDRDAGVYPNGHFHVRGKALLNWIPDSAVHHAYHTGTYRINAFDHGGASTGNGKLGLRVTNRFGDVFWVGYRANFPSGQGKKNAHLGATIVREIGTKHHLIDATPWSQDSNTEDFDDAALPVGQSWRDATGTLRIKVVGIGGTLPNRYLDFQVSMTAPSIELFNNEAATGRGLEGSYVDSVVSATGEPDWRQTRTIAGTRFDKDLVFTSGAAWGDRSEVNLTGGTGAAWKDFSVQWDGYLRVNYPLKLRTRSEDGSRMFIDYNGDKFLDITTETVNNSWASNSGPPQNGDWSEQLAPGLYKFRVQYSSSTGQDYFELDTESAPLFDFSTDLAGSQPGLDGSYFNQNLRSNSSDDWTSGVSVDGTRVDRLPFFRTNDLGQPDELNPIVGQGSNWGDFSVQWDGYLTLNSGASFTSRSDDGSRFMIDWNGNGVFGPNEITDNGSGSGQIATLGDTTFWPNAGTYKMRIQYEEGTGDNIYQFLGQAGQDDHGNLADFASLINDSLVVDGELFANDKDYFRFELTSETTVALGTTGSIDTFGTLRTLSGAEIDTDDDDGPGNNFLITQTLQAGSYILEVKGYNETTTGGYRIVNDKIMPEIQLSGSIGLTINRGESVPDQTVTLTNVGNGVLNYRVFPVGAWWVTASISEGTLPPGQSQDIVLEFDTSTLGGGFSLSSSLGIESLDDPSLYESTGVSVTINGPSDDYGGRPQSAKTLPATVGVLQAGNIEVGFDEDWFEFVLTEAATMEVWTSSSMGTMGALYDSEGVALPPGNDDAGGIFGDQFRIVRELTAGTYYVGVRSYLDRTGDYLLHANIHPEGLPFDFTNPVLSPGDAIIPIGLADGTPTSPSSSPASGDEDVARVIDRRFDTNYLNFGRNNTGFIVTPSVGSTQVRGFVMVTADDEENRDPVGWELFGTNEAIVSAAHSEGTAEGWTSIAAGTLSLPSARETMGSLAVFSNDMPYASYKLLVTSLKGPNPEAMQVAEVQFITGADVPEVTSLADSGAGSLRSVLSTLPSGGTIIFNESLSGGVLRFESGEIALDSEVTLDTSALADGLTLQGNGESRLFNISEGGGLHLSGVNITGANPGTLWGGAIRSEGMLTIEDSAVFGNSGGNGGAIYCEDNAQLVLRNVTFAHNHSSGFGGAVRLRHATTEALIENCTFSQNTAATDGGGLSSSGVLTIRNTILADNDAGAAAKNFHRPTTPVIQEGNLFDVEVALLPLGFYGGTTASMPPANDSLALNAATGTSIPVFDQNGFARVGVADAGAAEAREVLFEGVLTGMPGVISFTTSAPASVMTMLEFSFDLEAFNPYPATLGSGDSVAEVVFGSDKAFARSRLMSSFSEGLRAYWGFEGDADNSAYAFGDIANSENLNGTWGGDAQTGDGGILGDAALFDGDGDFIAISGEVVEDEPDSSFTVSSWFRADAVPSGNDRMFVYETSPIFTHSLSLSEGSVLADTTIQFFLDIAGNPDDGVIEFELPDSEVVGQVFHSAVTFDQGSKTFTVYLNGEEVGSEVITGTLSNFDSFRIGTYRDADGRWFDGVIDEVAIWERVLSPAEIPLLYNGGEPVRLTP
ncbi:LamG-like jellyroll fold domain-containing protein [Roseibacillus persicicus]|uniref:LamG-like jellyroll fold domain-containing protein n=1 Tax=Roseibacillus persicicus TaxID=454148 RepID=UPI00398A68A0